MKYILLPLLFVLLTFFSARAGRLGIAIDGGVSYLSLRSAHNAYYGSFTNTPNKIAITGGMQLMFTARHFQIGARTDRASNIHYLAGYINWVTGLDRDVSVYFGVNGGKEAVRMKQTHTSAVTGYGFGGQLGFNSKLSDKVNLIFEMSGKYGDIGYNDPSARNGNAFNMLILVGMRYQTGHNKAKKTKGEPAN